MSGAYAVNAGKNFSPDPSEPVFESIFRQYERVLVESLITSFGLDFLIKDQYGGDVDTIHNVRKIGQDEQMTYKNRSNQSAYENLNAYDSAEYHKDARYIARNRAISAQKKKVLLRMHILVKRLPEMGKVISTMLFQQRRYMMTGGVYWRV